MYDKGLDDRRTDGHIRFCTITQKTRDIRYRFYARGSKRDFGSKGRERITSVLLHKYDFHISSRASFPKEQTDPHYHQVIQSLDHDSETEIVEESIAEIILW